MLQDQIHLQKLGYRKLHIYTKGLLRTFTCEHNVNFWERVFVWSIIEICLSVDHPIFRISCVHMCLLLSLTKMLLMPCYSPSIKWGIRGGKDYFQMGKSSRSAKVGGICIMPWRFRHSGLPGEGVSGRGTRMHKSLRQRPIGIVQRTQGV